PPPSSNSRGQFTMRNVFDRNVCHAFAGPCHCHLPCLVTAKACVQARGGSMLLRCLSADLGFRRDPQEHGTQTFACLLSIAILFSATTVYAAEPAPQLRLEAGKFEVVGLARAD